MSDAPETLTGQIAVLEASLANPLPEAVRAIVVQQIAALRQQQAALINFGNAQTGAVSMGDLAAQDLTKGEVQVSSTLQGAAIGVNLGTIQISQPSPPAAHAASQSAHATPERAAHQRKLLEVHRTTLGHYLTRQAMLSSAHAPPEIMHGIREARAGIAKAKAALRGWGVAVEDLSDDA
ncbi:MAG: hypothetical protein EI684_12235 [Candidatus Viridilinea halotolerans]|uniref:Uncharacterized protein n=1 Tax=Candidatus Viridilinea halotolerans TaxID=2491704 RepID=A0A426TYF3_9CHLR|nr:MAG: hypothetical protein EI684_12235 [Candidatus Viridilinea halotolerans]